MLNLNLNLNLNLDLDLDFDFVLVLEKDKDQVQVEVQVEDEGAQSAFRTLDAILADITTRGSRGGNPPPSPRVAPAAPARGPGSRAVFTSEATTRGIKVRATSTFVPERSEPGQRRWFFSYRVRISNTGDEPVQLLNRHWVITDADGHVEEVRGPGVVGEQPTLGAGEIFEYTSFCPLSTPFGTMEGSYEMVTEGGERFLAAIAPFTLSEPMAVH